MSRSIPDRATPGVRALTAEHAGPPDRPCVQGEPVWADALCDDRPCRCERGWNGVASDGVTTVASVRLLPGVTRSEIRRALTDRMHAEGLPRPIATARAERLLALAAGLSEGTLLRLEQGRPVPFPPGSRMQGRRRAVSPAPRTGR